MERSIAGGDFDELVAIPRWAAIWLKLFKPHPRDEHTGPIVVPAWKVKGTIFYPNPAAEQEDVPVPQKFDG